MLNQVALIGKTTSKPMYTENAPTATPYKIFVAVEKEACDIAVYVWSGLADAINEKYPIGSIVGIKGSLTVFNGQLIVVAERISFITQKED